MARKTIVAFGIGFCFGIAALAGGLALHQAMGHHPVPAAEAADTVRGQDFAVAVALGMHSALTPPRRSGCPGAAESALAGDLAVLRNAIDMYAAEHNGTFPHADTIADQLIQYTDARGRVSKVKDNTYLYGNYLQCVPALPVGAAKGNAGISARPGDGVGWIYNATTGAIGPNTSPAETDTSGKKFSEY